MIGRLRYLKTIGKGELTFERVRDALLRRANDIPHRVAWEMPFGLPKRHREKLRAFEDKHAGERCFIVANGPSIRSMDLSKLNEEYTFGMNRGYRLKDSHGFLPTYLATIDMDSQLDQIAQDLKQLDIQQFINWNARHYFPDLDGITYVKMTFRPRFSTNLPRGLYGGHSVTYACLQLAYHMGFTEVILIGKDHSYAEMGTPTKRIVSTGAEDNHFVKGYYEKGQTWRIPDYKGEEMAYGMARAAFDAAGRRVLDATVDGKLEIFEKVSFDSLF